MVQQIIGLRTTSGPNKEQPNCIITLAQTLTLPSPTIWQPNRNTYSIANVTASTTTIIFTLLHSSS